MSEKIRQIIEEVYDEEVLGKANTSQDLKDYQKAKGTSLLDEILEKERGEYQGVSRDVYKFFKADPAKIDKREIKKLKDISDWAFDDADLTEGIKKLRELEIKLGSPRGDDERWDKIWQYLKMEKAIKDLQARQDSL